MKMTNLISIVMAVSGALMVLGGILNSASVVAISSGVVGKQDGGWYGIVALLLGLSVTGVFVYAYRQSIWNWWIRGSLIALSGVIFLVSTIGMADNFRADFDGGSYTWTQGGNVLQEETIRIVPQTFVVLDLDFVVVMMLLGSIGIAAAALWGAFRWESAKIEESQQEGIRDLLDELPPEVLQAGTNYGEELERYYGSPSRSSGGLTSPGPSGGPPESANAPDPDPAPPSVRRRRCPRCWTDQYEDSRFCHACGAGS